MSSGDRRKIDYQAIFDVVDEAAATWQMADDKYFANEQSEIIFKRILPSVLQRFVRKNADYGTSAAFLGVKGQFSDLNRKYWKLKRALWDEEELIGESLQEILSDLIGHSLLTLYFIDAERIAKAEQLAEHVAEVEVPQNPFDPEERPEGHGLRP